MKIRKKRAVLLAIGTLSAMALPACGLLPTEEVYKTAPVIRDYTMPEYKTGTCERMNLQLSEAINCSYVPVRNEELTFGVSGPHFDAFFVDVGDQVEEGTLLAQLDLSTLLSDIEKTERSLEQYEVELSYLDQFREIAVKKARIAAGGTETGNSAADRSDAVVQAVEAVNAQYDARQQSLTDSIGIAEMRLRDYEEQKGNLQIYAPFSGTVTKERSITDEDIPAITDVIVTLADSTMSVFRAETDQWDLLHPGDLYVITSSKVEYESKIVSEAELGLPETPHVKGEKGYVYFALTEPAFELEDNARGTATLIKDTREQVLAVPKEALSEIGGKTVVYYLDEQGIKAYKEVTVGLVAGKYAEILSGLAEGDVVILN